MFYKLKIQQKTGLNYFDAKEGLRKIKEGDFGFNVDSAVAYKYLSENLNQKEICELQEILLFPISPVTSPVKKGSPFLEFFRNRFVLIYMTQLYAKGITSFISFQKMVEGGITNYQDQHWMHPRPECFHSVTDVSQVDLKEFLPALLFLLAGVFCSLVILFMEIFWVKITFFAQRR